MSEIILKARTTRESLAKGLNQLQSMANPPPTYLQAAEPIAKAMGALHRLESGADAKACSNEALESVRSAMSILQTHGANDPNLAGALETVASCLGALFQLTQMTAQAPAPQPNVTQPVQQASAARGPAYGQPGAPAGGAQQPPGYGGVQPQRPQSSAAAQAPAYGQQPQQRQVQQQPVQQQPVYQPPPAQQQQGYRQPAQQGYQSGQQQPVQQGQPQQGYQSGQQQPVQQGQPQQGYQSGQQQPVQQGYQPQRGYQQPPAQQQPVQQQQAHQPQPAQSSQPSGQASGAGQASGGAWDPFASPSAARPQASPGAYRGNPENLPTIEASLGATSPSNFYKGLSGDDVIENGGLFIQTYQVPEVGTRYNVHVILPGGYEFDAIGVVRWTRESRDSMTSDIAPPGFGLQFTQISPEARQLVYRYVRNREPLFHDDL